jgi:multicomponent Na+:H+ antiporter subunit E
MISGKPGRRIASVVTRCLVLGGTWMALTGGRADDPALAVASIALAATASLGLAPDPAVHLQAIPRFLFFFLVQSLRGGAQVALLAVDPRRTPRSELQDFPLRLPDDGSRLTLAAILSLTPGTLGVELRGERLCLHVLDARHPVEPLVRAAEERIAALAGVTLA